MRRFFTLLFVFVSFVAVSQESVLLRVNYNEGDKYVTTSELIQDQGLLGSTTTNMTSDIVITKVTADEITSQTKTTWVKMDMYQGVNLAMSYDSSKGDDQLGRMGKTIKAQLDPMMKSTIISTMNRFGKLLKTEIKPSNPALGEMGPQSSGIEYPKEKVSVGSTWNDKTEDSGLKVTRIYTVDKIKNGTVYISISGTASGLGEGTIVGRTEIDIETGNQNIYEETLTLKAEGVEVKVSSKITTKKQ